jgi:hypothetical protein
VAVAACAGVVVLGETAFEAKDRRLEAWLPRSWKRVDQTALVREIDV